MRIREVVDALSTKPKPRKEAIQRFFKPWGVQQRIKKDLKALPKLIDELNKKVIDAAKKLQKKLQQQLSDSAERPVVPSDSAEQLVPMDTSADVDLDENPALAELRAHQRKRAQASAAEERRAAAKAKASVRPGKRTQSTTSDSVEQPASKRQQQRITAESFTAFAHDPLEPSAASSSSAGQPAPGQQQSQRMVRLLQELQKLKKEGWLVYDLARYCVVPL